MSNTGNSLLAMKKLGSRQNDDIFGRFGNEINNFISSFALGKTVSQLIKLGF